jgi:hypothetical protein
LILDPLLGHPEFSRHITDLNLRDLGRVMVDVAINKTGESRYRVLENREIRAMVESRARSK